MIQLDNLMLEVYCWCWHNRATSSFKLSFLLFAWAMEASWRAFSHAAFLDYRMIKCVAWRANSSEKLVQIWGKRSLGHKHFGTHCLDKPNGQPCQTSASLAAINLTTMAPAERPPPWFCEKDSSSSFVAPWRQVGVGLHMFLLPSGWSWHFRLIYDSSGGGVGQKNCIWLHQPPMMSALMPPSLSAFMSALNVALTAALKRKPWKTMHSRHTGKRPPKHSSGKAPLRADPCGTTGQKWLSQA